MYFGFLTLCYTLSLIEILLLLFIQFEYLICNVIVTIYTVWREECHSTGQVPQQYGDGACWWRLDYTRWILRNQRSLQRYDSASGETFAFIYISLMLMLYSRTLSLLNENMCSSQISLYTSKTININSSEQFIENYENQVFAVSMMAIYSLICFL